MTRTESGAGLRRAESPDGEGDLTRDRQFTHYLAEEDEDEQVSRGLDHLVSEAPQELGGRGRRSPWWLTQPRSMFPEIGIR